jgi:hypothetical protein
MAGCERETSKQKNKTTGLGGAIEAQGHEAPHQDPFRQLHEAGVVPPEDLLLCEVDGEPEKDFMLKQK